MDPITMMALGSFGGSLISGLSDVFGGGKEEREVNAAMEAFEYPELKNVFEGLSISTMGADILREDAAQLSSDIIESGRSSGARNLFGALPKAVDTQMKASKAAATDIDRQFSERERLVAGDERRIQQTEQARAEQELAGMGAKLNYAKQRKQQGTRDLINTGFAAASMFGGASGASNEDFEFDSPDFDALKLGMPRNYGF